MTNIISYEEAAPVFNTKVLETNTSLCIDIELIAVGKWESKVVKA